MSIKLETKGLGEAGKRLEEIINRNLKEQSEREDNYWIGFSISKDGKQIVIAGVTKSGKIIQMAEIHNNRFDSWKILLKGHFSHSKETESGE